MNFNRIYEADEKQQNKGAVTQNNQNQSANNKVNPQNLTEIAKGFEERVNNLKKIYQSILEIEEPLKLNAEARNNSKFQGLNNTAQQGKINATIAANNIKNGVANFGKTITGNLNNNNNPTQVNQQQMANIYSQNNSPEVKFQEILEYFKKDLETVTKMYTKSFQKNLKKYIDEKIGNSDVKQNNSEALKDVQKDNSNNKNSGGESGNTGDAKAES